MAETFAAADKADAEPPFNRARQWHFRDWAIPLRFDVGAGFGVPVGLETRCLVESQLGRPDVVIHTSTFYTLVDYQQQGMRFYYDKDDRTLSYTTFPIPAPSMYHAMTPKSVTIWEED